MLNDSKELMIKMFTLPKNVTIWLQVLMFVNMVIPLFFFKHIEAKVILAAFMINFMTGVLLYKKFGFTRILGLMHWAWIPLVVFLITQSTNTSIIGVYGLWIKSVIGINSLSLFFDIKDVVEYSQGNLTLLNQKLG